LPASLGAFVRQRLKAGGSLLSKLVVIVSGRNSGNGSDPNSATYQMRPGITTIWGFDHGFLRRKKRGQFRLSPICPLFVPYLSSPICRLRCTPQRQGGLVIMGYQRLASASPKEQRLHCKSKLGWKFVMHHDACKNAAQRQPFVHFLNVLQLVKGYANLPAL
jgi:hypothetical protein